MKQDLPLLPRVTDMSYDEETAATRAPKLQLKSPQLHVQPVRPTLLLMDTF